MYIFLKYPSVLMSVPRGLAMQVGSDVGASLLPAFGSPPPPPIPQRHRKAPEFIVSDPEALLRRKFILEDIPMKCESQTCGCHWSLRQAADDDIVDIWDKFRFYLEHLDQSREKNCRLSKHWRDRRNDRLTREVHMQSCLEFLKKDDLWQNQNEREYIVYNAFYPGFGDMHSRNSSQRLNRARAAGAAFAAGRPAYQSASIDFEALQDTKDFLIEALAKKGVVDTSALVLLLDNLEVIPTADMVKSFRDSLAAATKKGHDEGRKNVLVVLDEGMPWNTNDDRLFTTNPMKSNVWMALEALAEDSGLDDVVLWGHEMDEPQNTWAHPFYVDSDGKGICPGLYDEGKGEKLNLNEKLNLILVDDAAYSGQQMQHLVRSLVELAPDKESEINISKVSVVLGAATEAAPAVIQTPDEYSSKASLVEVFVGRTFRTLSQAAKEKFLDDDSKVEAIRDSFTSMCRFIIEKDHCDDIGHRRRTKQLPPVFDSLSLQIPAHKLPDDVSTYAALVMGTWYPEQEIEKGRTNKPQSILQSQQTLVKECNAVGATEAVYDVLDESHMTNLRGPKACLPAWYKTQLRKVTGGQCLFQQGAQCKFSIAQP